MRKIHEAHRSRWFRLCVSIIVAAVVAGFADPEISPGQMAYPPQLWKAIIAEATADGHDGMLAVAVCVRNRLNAGMNPGLVAAKRKDLDAFVAREGKSRAAMAKDIVKKVFEEGSVPDVVKGALYYENFERYGAPKWAHGKKIIVTCKVGSHTFFNVK